MGDRPKRPTGVDAFDGAAGGWSALKAATSHLREQQIVWHGHRTLLNMNKPDGFDCPGCAWPDSNPHGSFEYCENGAKAIAWEATRKRADPDFFARWPVKKLRDCSDHWLENQGRITDPMRYNADSDCYEPVPWDDALADIGRQLGALDNPNQAEYYTSGRTSNEAAFLLQLMARLLGTNNFPDCSNLCHEASSVGLPIAIGVGKGTVSLEDFSRSEAIFSFGHNPATNHPRMLGVLRDAAKNGAKIVAFNPIKERGLQRFRDPKSVGEMLSGKSTMLATHYYQLRVGGDIAAINGMLKALLARPDGYDQAFIDAHTEGFATLSESLRALPWPEIEKASGLTREELTEAAEIYAESDATIIAYGMGITQHQHGTQNVQALANLALVKGNIGKPGAGICPVRGHSNVQGDRTVGIWEKPTGAFIDRLEAGMGMAMPREPGHTVIESIEAMRTGQSKAFLAMGGNLVSASPEPGTVLEAIASQALTVSIATKLNRSHLGPGKTAYLLPCLGRTELDIQSSGPQAVTVEDSMSMVHASRGANAPASPQLMSECAIVAGIAKHALPDVKIAWDDLSADYAQIRDLIERCIAGFNNFNERIKTPGGFQLPNAARERKWLTPNGKANFLITHISPQSDDGKLLLTTVRSHDQYNTSIYGFDDRYRGIKGRRDVLFMNESDIEKHDLYEGCVVELVNCADASLRLTGLTVVGFDVAVGSCATYFPEANQLIALSHFDRTSSTPGYKSIPVYVRSA